MRMKGDQNRLSSNFTSPLDQAVDNHMMSCMHPVKRSGCDHWIDNLPQVIHGIMSFHGKSGILLYRLILLFLDKISDLLQGGYHIILIQVYIRRYIQRYGREIKYTPYTCNHQLLCNHMRLIRRDRYYSNGNIFLPDDLF